MSLSHFGPEVSSVSYCFVFLPTGLRCKLVGIFTLECFHAERWGGQGCSALHNTSRRQGAVLIRFVIRAALGRDDSRSKRNHLAFTGTGRSIGDLSRTLILERRASGRGPNCRVMVFGGGSPARQDLSFCPQACAASLWAFLR